MALARRTVLHDALYLTIFVIAIVACVLTINTFIFRTYTVEGGSMESTLQPDDHLIVNKLPVTWAHLFGHDWQPERGQIIVFKNPLWDADQAEEYVVKRVIGLPSERVVVHDGVLTVYNRDYPKGFQPDTQLSGIVGPSSGEVDRTVEEKTIFVCGDNRVTSHSLDSRNGLSTIPLSSIQGVVGVRILPVNHLRWF